MSTVGVLIAVVLISIPIALAAVVASMAGRKGRSRAGWFVFGLFAFVPALVAVLVVKPDHSFELADWVARGGALCTECREPLNPGATRCRTCGAAQLIAAPASIAPRPLPPTPDDPTEEDDALEFFADELKNVAGTSIIGRDQNRDERLILTPIAAPSRLRNDAVRRRCERLVRDAMADAADRTGWLAHDGMRLPRSWIAPYEVLAELDQVQTPALIALIERCASKSSLH